jgi:hypothetical protein
MSDCSAARKRGMMASTSFITRHFALTADSFPLWTTDSVAAYMKLIGTSHIVLSRDGTRIGYLSVGTGPSVLVVPGVLSMAALVEESDLAYPILRLSAIQKSNER